MVFDYLEYGFMQRALIAGILISLSTSILGVYLILKRLSLLADGLAHASFAGVSIGFLFNFNPLISGIVVAGLSSLGIERLIRKTKLYGDSAIALILSASMAVAITIIGFVNGFNANLFSFIFGSILSISFDDLLILGIVSILVIVFSFIYNKKLLFVTFNDDMAKTQGINVKLVNSILVVLAAIATVAAIKAVGILLVTGLTVIPALFALQHSKSFKSTLIYASLFSVISMIIGIFLSFELDLPPSGIIILTMVTIFTLSLISLPLKK